MPEYKTVTQPVANPAPTRETYEPRRTPTVQSDVAVPLLQAVITATLIGCAVGMLGGLFSYILLGGWHWQLVGLSAAGSFIGALLRSWYWRLEHADSTIEKAEVQLGIDLNRDGYIGAHPYNVGRNADRLTDNRVMEQERVRFCAFVRAAEKSSTVRGLHAQGWRNDILNEVYRSWLLDMVRLPDGTPAARTLGNGQWELTAPAADILPAIEAMEWVVAGGAAQPRPR